MFSIKVSLHVEFYISEMGPCPKMKNSLEPKWYPHLILFLGEKNSNWKQSLSEHWAQYIWERCHWGKPKSHIDFYCGLMTILLMIFLGQFKSARNKVRLQSHSRLSDCVLHKESMLFKCKLLHPILHKSNAIFCLNLNYKCDAISGGMAWRSNRTVLEHIYYL